MIQILKFTKVWLLCCLCVQPSSALAGAIEDLNNVRRAAGLAALESSAELNLAAQSHAEYLARYMPPAGLSSGSAHEQSASLPEFTGKLAADRAATFDYPHTLVTENVSVGNQTTEESISSLMSAIYHRLAFLDPQIDQLGFAEVERRYVFNMGRRDLAQTCLSQNEAARPVPPRNCLGKQIRASVYQHMCQNMPGDAIYAKPYPSRCPDGGLLNDQFMQTVCAQPPADAVFRGTGRYYNACNNGLKVSASWFDRICRSEDPNIIYPHSGSFYEICSPLQRVHAQWYENFCDNLPPEAAATDSGSYYRVCNNGFQVKSEYLDVMRTKALRNMPEAVVWPADGVSDIQPVFYDEDPHPTPDLSMTGYPISIQFNEQMVQQASIMGFTLEEEDEHQPGTWLTVSPIRMIDHLSDINDQLTEHQFAWFPLQRLHWGARYRYQIDALVDGEFRQYGAQFQTTQLPVPVYRVKPESGQVTVGEKHFILYRAPDAFDDSPFKQIGLTYQGRPYVDVSVIDTNTVELKAGGSGCAPVFLSTRLEERIRIDFCGNSRLRNLFRTIP